MEVQDIDDMNDWLIAEIKYEYLIRNEGYKCSVLQKK